MITKGNIQSTFKIIRREVSANNSLSDYNDRPLIVNRRKFFFFGLAAGIGLMLPNTKIELDNDNLNMFFNVEDLKDLRIPMNFKWYGIPYHQNNGTTGTWLGFNRT